MSIYQSSPVSTNPLKSQEKKKKQPKNLKQQETCWAYFFKDRKNMLFQSGCPQTALSE